MHQSWPKFVQNLYYATPDQGVAALLYAPSSVRLQVADGREVQIEQETGFPFREEVNFKIDLAAAATFPFHLRIPDWCTDPQITINGEVWEASVENNLAIVDREWNTGDVLQLKLPMQLKTSLWHEFSQAVERGPLVYALKIRGLEKIKDLQDRFRAFREVYPLDDWNYGLLATELADPAANIQVIENSWDGTYPWNLENAPIELRLKGIKIPEWTLTNGAPYFPAFWGRYSGDPQSIEEITLIPYGCTTLRITEFPVYDL
jgi:hypothetical protein